MLGKLVHFVGTLALSFGLALYLTPLVRRGALRFGVVDHPDGVLKHQREPVAYLGGIAVYLSFVVALGVVFEFSAALLGLLLGATMVTMLGLFDDLRVLPPAVKLAGQVLAALALVKSDVAIHIEALPAAVAWPLTVLWLAGVSNAVNLIDVSDGLATITSVVAALGLFTVAVLSGELLIATTTLALMGALLGFLAWNRPPARIYLGDAGSLFIGFSLGALAMELRYSETHVGATLAPLAFFVVPLAETGLVTLARLAKRRSPVRGSPDHFAVRLKARGWSSQGVMRLGAAWSLVGSGIGVAMVLRPELAVQLLGGLASLTLLGLVWLARACPAPR